MDRTEAGETPRSLPDDTELPMLRMRVRGADLALDATTVEEIVEPRAVTPVPCAPRHIRGLINVRGDAVPLLDLATFFALAPGDRDALERIVVVRTDRYRVGLICDEVLGVRSVPARAIGIAETTQPPQLRRHARGELTFERVVAAVLDLDALLEAARA